jgi:hypothetical protein
MCEVSRHLHPFYVKHGLCQLTDHAYDMSMSIYKLHIMVKCMCYTGLWIY